MTDIATVLRDRSLETVFQPIVDIDTGEHVAYEALTRGPEASRLRSPSALFDAARRANRLEELEWMCRSNALRAAAAAGLRPPLTVFLNIEPEVLGDDPPESEDNWMFRTGGLRVVVELTEHALFARPGDLLHFVETVRHWGWGVAVDDVGVERHSLALLPIVEPDVVKVDLAQAQMLGPAARVELLAAVTAYQQESGAVAVMEKIEDDEGLVKARTSGVSFAQGHLFGRPGPLAPGGHRTSKGLPMLEPRPHLPARRLFDMAARRGRVVRLSKRELARTSWLMEVRAVALGPNAVVLATVQDRRNLTDAFLRRYESLAQQCAYVAVLGAGIDPSPAPGVHGVSLRRNDPLLAEWVVCVSGPHERVALVAVDLGDDGPDRNRSFDTVVVRDPSLVTDIARALMARM